MYTEEGGFCTSFYMVIFLSPFRTRMFPIVWKLSVWLIRVGVDHTTHFCMVKVVDTEPILVTLLR